MVLQPPSFDVYVETHGCAANFADGEMLRNVLTQTGFRVVGSPREAAILIYNTCAVKGPTENRMVHILRKAPSRKIIIVTGCLPAINPKRLIGKVRFDAALGPAAGIRILNAIEAALRRECFFQIDSRSKPSLDLLGQSPQVVKIIPVSYGCLSRCAFCAVPSARGTLRSYSIEEIAPQVSSAVALGAKEIHLTATDLGCYGWDLGSNLIELLHVLLDIHGDFHIRLGMMNPAYAKHIIDGLAKALLHPRLFKFIHLPLQSGDDEVLKAMGRHYTVKEFMQIAQSLRGTIPDLTLATDMICGFPGENEEAFQTTLDALIKVQPDVVHVSKFQARPGTAAMKMTPLDARTVKARSARASRLARELSLARNKLWVDWRGEIIIDERGKEGTWMGRNYAYKPIYVRSEKCLLGRTLSVRLTHALCSGLNAMVMDSG